MPQAQGAGTVFVGGPGTSLRGPLYVKVAPVAGKPAGSFTYTQVVDKSGNLVGPNALQIVTVSISSAQLLALHTTPVNLSLLTGGGLLAAPGTTSMILVDWVVGELVYGTATYANGGALTITYGTGGPVAHVTALPAALVTAGQSETFATAGGFTAVQTKTATVNVALWIQAAGADFITGDGTLTLILGVRIIPGM